MASSGFTDEYRERLREIADELDPPTRLPGPVPFKSEADAAAFLRRLADRQSSNQTDHPQEQAETEIRQYAEWEGAPTQPEDWPAAIPLYKHVGPTGKVVTNPRGAVVSLGLELDKVEQRFYVPADHPQEPSSESEIKIKARALLDALDTAEKLAAGGEEQEANVNRVLTAAARELRTALGKDAREAAIRRSRIRTQLEGEQ